MATQLQQLLKSEYFPLEISPSGTCYDEDTLVTNPEGDCISSGVFLRDVSEETPIYVTYNIFLLFPEVLSAPLYLWGHGGLAVASNFSASSCEGYNGTRGS